MGIKGEWRATLAAHFPQAFTEKLPARMAGCQRVTVEDFMLRLYGMSGRYELQTVTQVCDDIRRHVRRQLEQNDAYVLVWDRSDRVTVAKDPERERRQALRRVEQLPVPAVDVDSGYAMGYFPGDRLPIEPYLETDDEKTRTGKFTAGWHRVMATKAARNELIGRVSLSLLDPTRELVPVGTMLIIDNFPEPLRGRYRRRPAVLQMEPGPADEEATAPTAATAAERPQPFSAMGPDGRRWVQTCKAYTPLLTPGHDLGEADVAVVVWLLHFSRAEVVIQCNDADLIAILLLHTQRRIDPQTHMLGKPVWLSMVRLKREPGTPPKIPHYIRINELWRSIMKDARAAQGRDDSVRADAIEAATQRALAALPGGKPPTAAQKRKARKEATEAQGPESFFATGSRVRSPVETFVVAMMSCGGDFVDAPMTGAGPGTVIRALRAGGAGDAMVARDICYGHPQHQSELRMRQEPYLAMMLQVYLNTVGGASTVRTPAELGESTEPASSGSVSDASGDELAAASRRRHTRHEDRRGQWARAPGEMSLKRTVRALRAVRAVGNARAERLRREWQEKENTRAAAARPPRPPVVRVITPDQRVPGSAAIRANHRRLHWTLLYWLRSPVAGGGGVPDPLAREHGRSVWGWERAANGRVVPARRVTHHPAPAPVAMSLH